MPSSMCWPCSDSRQWTSVSVSSANQSMRSPEVPDPGAVDPAAEVRRGRDVGTDRDDVRGDLGRVVREVDEEAPERLLRRGAAGVRRGRRRPAGSRRGGRRDRLALEPRGGLSAQLRLGRSVGEARPRIGGVGAELGGELLPLLGRQQRRVVGRVALGRQPPRLDRVGEDHRRPVGRPRRPRANASSRSPRSWPPRSRIARSSSSSSRSAMSRVDVLAAAAAAREPLAQLAGAAAQQALVLLVGHRVDALRAARRRHRASNSSRSRRPYLTVIVCQPAASNIAPMRPAAMSGTTRSSDWRLRSTIHSTSPRRGTIGSTSASQIAPSSSSASPSSATWRPPCGTSK